MDVKQHSFKMIRNRKKDNVIVFSIFLLSVFHAIYSDTIIDTSNIKYSSKPNTPLSTITFSNKEFALPVKESYIEKSLFA